MVEVCAVEIDVCKWRMFVYVCCSDCVGGLWKCLLCLSVSSCRYCMFVSCVYPVAVLNAAFCMTCSLLMLVEDARGNHMKEEYFRAGLMTAL